MRNAQQKDKRNQKAMNINQDRSKGKSCIRHLKKPKVVKSKKMCNNMYLKQNKILKKLKRIHKAELE